MAEKEYYMNIEPLLPHYNVILYLVQDEKSVMHVSRSVPIAAVTNQYFRSVVGNYHRVVTTDHDWNSDKVIPLVTLHINIPETYGESLYGGGTMDLAIFLSWSIIQPLTVQLESIISQMCMRY